MKRSILVLISLVSIVILFGFPGAAFGQKQPVTLKFAEIHEASYPTTVGDFEIARLVKERTKGRVIIDIYHSMKLGDEAVVIKKVQEGEIDLTRINWTCNQIRTELECVFAAVYFSRCESHAQSGKWASGQ